MSRRKKFRVAITNPYVSPVDIERRILGAVAEILVTDRAITTERELLSFAGDCNALMLGVTEPITRRVIQSMPNLRILSRYGIGVDNVDIAAATEKGIMVTNVPDFGLDEVADHAFALLLAITRRLPLIDRAVRQGKWLGDVQKLVGPINSPSTQTLGLLGFGNIAKRVALRAKPFGYRIIAYDPWVKRWEFSLLGVERVATLEELLSRSDAISIHVSLSQSSRRMIGREQLRMMKSGAVLVNTSRGQIIDQAALCEALRGGRIAGAALDVFEEEPLTHEIPLVGLENTILTPHISWYTVQSRDRLKTETATAVADCLEGKVPEFLVNPEVARS